MPYGVGMRMPIVVLAALAFGGCSDNDDIPAPRVSSVSPSAAPPGAIVTVAGAYLCQQPETGSDDDPLDCSSVDGIVYFGTAPGVTSLYTDTQITVEVPEIQVGSVEVSVTSTGRDSNSVSFTIN
jgi:uncharacterized protein (TIGR03437 family)